jgi:hypothetical protein
MFLRARIHVVWLFLVLAASTSCFARDFIVRNAAEVAVASRQALPGDYVLLREGTWKDQYLQFSGSGKKGAAITLKPQSPGKVVFTGNSRLDISGSWLVADGLRFENGALSERQHIVRFTGSMGDAIDCRLTNSIILNYNPPNPQTRYFWVALHGKRNQVDHCRFEGQNNEGVTVAVMRPKAERDDHLIEYNYFLNRPAIGRNGGESIRIGTGPHASSSSGTIVQHNLFERTNSDLEVISIKSSDNIIRFNTFRQVAGTITLRQGDRNKITGNFIIGDGADGTGGIRVTGNDHLIANNILQDLRGTEGGGILLICGNITDQKAAYTEIRRVVIAHNTLVNVNGALLKLDNRCDRAGQKLLAEDLEIVNNLLVNMNGQLVDGEEGGNWHWKGNLGYSPTDEKKTREGLRQVKSPAAPVVKGGDGVWRPDPSSPARKGGVKNAFVVDDIDGQKREEPFDVGADQIISSDPVLNRPLTAMQVGPHLQ